MTPLSVIGQWHTIQKGDTVENVAQKYGTAPETLAELNELPATGSITDREQIFIPLPSGEPPGDGKPPKVVSVHPAEKDSAVAPATSPTNIVEGLCGKENRPCFIWPVNGEFVRGFGTDGDSHHDGVDIAAPKGTAVTAVADGEVLYSGDAIKGYGNLILIRHKDNIITVYAHNEKNLIAEGATVKREDKIAEVGQSGAASNVHLHFEVRVDEQPVNPLLYLPSLPTHKE